MKRNWKNRITPYHVILIGFLAMILIGCGLLMLPISTKGGISWIDALFLSASSVCITGLSPINLSTTLTGFGEAVVALLIQIGGLGFVTIAMTAIVMLKMRLGISGKRLVDETLGASARLDYRAFLPRAVAITLVVEGIGFCLNMIALSGDYAGGRLIWLSVFHAISSFNNAGLDLFGNSLIPYSHNVLLLLSTSILTILGGLGFIVIYDILTVRRWKRLSVHTKIVLFMTPFLLLSGTFLFTFSEFGKIDFLNAFFMSAMARTCGFTTQDLSQWSNASLCILNLLMFIGAAPVSTGGGVKCTTVFVFFVSLWGFIRGKQTTAFRRRIPSETVVYALLVTTLAVIYVFFTGMIVSAFDPDLSLTFIFTETVSALANVGFSAGITSVLSTGSKLALVLAMYAGRVGFMTLLLVFKRRTQSSDSGPSYVNADIIIG